MSWRRDRIRRDMRRKIDRSLRPSETSYERDMDDIVGDELADMGCDEMQARLLDLADYAADQEFGGRIAPTRFRSSLNKAFRPLVFFAFRSGCVTDGERIQLSRGMRSIRASLGRPEGDDAIRAFKSTVRQVL